MSLNLINNAQLINSNIYLTNGVSQSGSAILAIPPANSFVSRYFYTTQASSKNILTSSWGDSNINLNLIFNQGLSNISLLYGSNLLASSNSYPFTTSSNFVVVRQTLNACKIYINEVQNMNCPLISEINPISGSFTWKATSSNSSSNIIAKININNALTYSNDAEYLGDLSVFGEIENVGISALSNFCLVNYSNLNLLNNTNNSFSNDIYGKSLSNSSIGAYSSNSFSNYTISNIVFQNLNNLSNSAFFGSNLSVYGSNSFSNYTISNIVFQNLNNLSNSAFFGSNIGIYGSNSLSNYTTSNIVFQNLNNLSNSTFYGSNIGNWCSNNLSNIATSSALTTYSNFISLNYTNSSITFSNLNNLSNCVLWSSNLAGSNLSRIITLSNSSYSNFVYSSNTSVFGSNTSVFGSNTSVFASNTSVFGSNTSVFGSNASVFGSNTSVFSSNLCILNSNNNSNYTTSNILFPLINNNTTRSVFSSNYLSNCRILSSLVPWNQVSGKPDFSSDGAGNDAIGISGVTIGSAGLLMSGYALLDKNGKLTNALTDSLGKMTIDPSGYFKLNDPGSYIDIGNSTTRLSKDRLLFKTGTFSNMVLNPGNLSFSNAIFSLCNQIALTATSISNLTHVSCSSNLTVLGNAGVGSLTCTGLSLTSGLTTVGGVMSTMYASNLLAGQYELNNFGVSQSSLNAAFTGFAFSSNGSSNNYASLGLWGYNLGSQTLNVCGNGKFGVCTTSPTATLDIAGTANVSTTLTSATHSNSGNMQIGGTLSCANLTNQTRKVWNAGKLGVWGTGGTQYYLLSTSPNDAAGNASGGLRISGTLGGFFRDNICQLDCTITNRGGIRYLGDTYGAITEAQKWCDIVVYNSNNVQWQYLLATYQSYSGFDLEVSQGDLGVGSTLMEPSSTPFYSNLIFNSSNTSLGSVLSNMNFAMRNNNHDHNHKFEYVCQRTASGVKRFKYICDHF
jgi:hypothetical protein